MQRESERSLEHIAYFARAKAFAGKTVNSRPRKTMGSPDFGRQRRIVKGFDQGNGMLVVGFRA